MFLFLMKRAAMYGTIPLGISHASKKWGEITPLERALAVRSLSVGAHSDGQLAQGGGRRKKEKEEEDLRFSPD